MLDVMRSAEHVIAVLVVALGLTVIPAQAEDPYLVTDIWPGPGDSYLNILYAVDGLVFFRATDGTDGFELYRSNGVNSGTFQIEDLRPGSTGSNPSTFGDLSGNLLFTASDGSVSGLWRSDGTPESITLIKSDFIIPGGRMERMGNHVYFPASVVGPSGGDTELWRSDGTLAGTVRVKDINPGNVASNPEYMVGVGSTLFFAAYDNTHGTELWSSDGTEIGTVVFDISNGAPSSSPTDLTRIGDRLFLMADNGVDGAELWVVDAGIVSMIDICPGPCSGGAGGITEVGDIAYFRSLGDGTTGPELWRSDGTALGTDMVKEIGPDSGGAYIDLITDFDGTLVYFIADNGVNGRELWRSDGTEDGTWMVKDINPGGDSMSNVNSEIIAAGGLVYFSADDGINGFELWRSDGTEAGTTLAYNFHISGNGYPSLFTQIGDRLLFGAADVDHGYELWGLRLCLFCDGFEEGDILAWTSTWP